MSPEVYPGKATTPYFLMRQYLEKNASSFGWLSPEEHCATCRGGEGHRTAQVVLKPSPAGTHTGRGI